MKKSLYAALLVIIVTEVSAQQPDTVNGKLLSLKMPKRVVEKYVNFDVVKLMIGHGRTPYGVSQGVGLSIEFQGLVPWALFKNSIMPIAYGIRAGTSKITMLHSALEFTDNRLTAIHGNKSINSTLQRTGHIGLIALYVRQFKREGYTLLAGASANYNMCSKLKERTRGKDSKLKSGRYIHRVSIPLHLQVSRSKLQFLSWGFHFSFDTRPRFKGQDFTGLKQMVIGGSVALII